MWPTPSESAEMTLPSDSSPRLIWTPSSFRVPSALVRFNRSDQAKSINLNMEHFESSGIDLFCCSSRIVKQAWEREDVAFISVAPTDRFVFPFANCSRMDVAVATVWWDRSEMVVVPSGCSRTWSILVGVSGPKYGPLDLKENTQTVSRDPNCQC